MQKAPLPLLVIAQTLVKQKQEIFFRSVFLLQIWLPLWTHSQILITLLSGSACRPVDFFKMKWDWLINIFQFFCVRGLDHSYQVTKIRL